MIPALDTRYRSRKFIIAGASLIAASFMAIWGTVMLAKDGGDLALIIAAWTASDAAILKLYNDANLKDEEGAA